MQGRREGGVSRVSYPGPQGVKGPPGPENIIPTIGGLKESSSNVMLQRRIRRGGGGNSVHVSPPPPPPPLPNINS